MPNLFQNPFDSIVRAAYGGAPPYSQSPITPPFLPPTPQRTSYDELSNDPAYTQLEEELKQILRAKRNTGTRAKIGNVLRAGLASASQPNRAFGGPMDILSAISGGMSGAQDQDILQQKLFNEEQARQANSIQGMLEERRRKAVAEAQMGSYNATRARNEWMMNRPAAPPKSTFLTPGGGQVLKTLPDGTFEWLPVPGHVKPATEEEKATARLNATIDAIAKVEDDFKAGKFDESGRRARLKALRADVAPEVQKNDLNAAAVTRLAARGVLNPDPLEVATERAALESELAKLYPKSTKAGKTKTQGQSKNETLAALHQEFQANGNIFPADDAGRKKYYQAMSVWINTPEVKERIPSTVFDDVLKRVESMAGRTLGRSRGLSNQDDLGDTKKKGAATPSAPSPKPTGSPRVLRNGDIVDGMKFIGTTKADANNPKKWVKVTGGMN